MKYCLVIKGKNSIDIASEYDELELKKELIDLINAGLSLSQASKYLARKTNLSKKEIYNMY